MFKWFWTIFSSGAPEKFAPSNSYFTVKSRWVPLKERVSREAARRERVFLTLPAASRLSLSLSRRKFQENLWDYGTLRIAQPWMTHQWILGLDSHTVGSYTSHGTKLSWWVFESTLDWNISDQLIPYDNDIFQKSLGQSLTIWYKTLLSKPPPSSFAPWPRYLWQPPRFLDGAREFGKETTATKAAIFHFFCFTLFWEKQIR